MSQSRISAFATTATSCPTLPRLQSPYATRGPLTSNHHSTTTSAEGCGATAATATTSPLVSLLSSPAMMVADAPLAVCGSHSNTNNGSSSSSNNPPAPVMLQLPPPPRGVNAEAVRDARRGPHGSRTSSPNCSNSLLSDEVRQKKELRIEECSSASCSNYRASFAPPQSFSRSTPERPDHLITVSRNTNFSLAFSSPDAISICPPLNSGSCSSLRGSFSALKSVSTTTSAPTSSQRLSKCKRRLQCMSHPAFDLKAVQEAQGSFLEEDAVCNAATCHPLSHITDILCIGTWKDASNPELLRQHGIRYVLNVAKEVDPVAAADQMAQSNFFVTLSIPMNDCHSQDLAAHLRSAFLFIEQAREAQSRVLVHCRRGISRSAAIVIAYLMASEHRSYENALQYVTARRSCISLNLAFQEHLAEYRPSDEFFHGPPPSGVAEQQAPEKVAGRRFSTPLSAPAAVQPSALGDWLAVKPHDPNVSRFSPHHSRSSSSSSSSRVSSIKTDGEAVAEPGPPLFGHPRSSDAATEATPCDTRKNVMALPQLSSRSVAGATSTIAEFKMAPCSSFPDVESDEELYISSGPVAGRGGICEEMERVAVRPSSQDSPSSIMEIEIRQLKDLHETIGSCSTIILGSTAAYTMEALSTTPFGTQSTFNEGSGISLPKNPSSPSSTRTGHSSPLLSFSG